MLPTNDAVRRRAGADASVIRMKKAAFPHLLVVQENAIAHYPSLEG
jgi:hypothetical protein